MKYFIGFMVTVIIIIILLVASLGNVGRRPSNNNKPANNNLVSYANGDSFVRMTVDGPVSANQDHYQVVVTVSNEKTIYEQIKGYNGEVIKSESFNNNQNSFSTFLSALQKAGYMNGDKEQSHASYQGFCSLGNRYIFSLYQNNKKVQQYWTSDCGSPKTYLGNFPLTYDLFQAQVPNYVDLTNDISLY